MGLINYNYYSILTGNEHLRDITVFEEFLTVKFKSTECLKKYERFSLEWLSSWCMTMTSLQSKIKFFILTCSLDYLLHFVVKLTYSTLFWSPWLKYLKLIFKTQNSYLFHIIVCMSIQCYNIKIYMWVHRYIGLVDCYWPICK